MKNTRLIQKTVGNIELQHACRKQTYGKSGYWCIAPDGKTYLGRNFKNVIKIWHKAHMFIGGY